MEVREMICIRCPLGCPLTVRMEGDQVEVTGNSCSRGEEYGKKEVLSPTRVVTSSVRVMGGDLEMVPVKTKEDIPKDKIFACMEEIRKMEVSAPVSIGDVIIPDCAGKGVSIVATRNVEKV
ncbi:MAG TPA: NAD(FAD)-dependent dehydrogenase [Lachnoclostridium sp.]|nr:NAD(FAD)-dependent dehydrogenase [Lachnoclostridium sp.]